MVHDEAGHELIERHMLEQLREVAEYTRVVLINGPRQAGKTTLLQQLHAELGGWLRSLDVDVERASARADPGGVHHVRAAPDVLGRGPVRRGSVDPGDQDGNRS